MKCFRHPDRRAKRNCFECKKAVCPECQLRADGHVFCAEDCHQKWLAQKELKQQKRTARSFPKPQVKLGLLETKLGEITGEHHRLELRLKQFEQDQQSRSRTLMIAAGLAAIVLLALTLTLGSYFWLRKPAPALAAGEPTAAKKFDPGYPGTLSEIAFLEPPSLELPPGELKSVSGQMDFYGRAPGAKKAVFLLNGRELMSVQLSQPEFVFKGVALTEGSNLAQVLSEDGQGNQSYSIAQMISNPGKGLLLVGYTPGLDYSHGRRDFPGVALTFDAGGDEGYGRKLLEVLREQGITTTIFITGQFISDHPDLVRQMVEDGHEVGNHTYSHPHLTTWEQNSRQWTAPSVTREFVRNELLSTAQLFRETTGVEMARLWRAPYGEQNREIRKWAEEAGFYHIGWSRSGKMNYDTLDWLCDKNSAHYRSPDDIRGMLTEIAANHAPGAEGSIILMHLSTGRGDKFPAQVIAPALEAFSAQGLKLVKVSELLPGLTGTAAKK